MAEHDGNSPRPRDAPPERLGRYRLVRPISTGGMARVFEGRRESLAGVSPRVAVKVILPDFATDEGFQRLFVNEARIGSQLQHQNLVQIQDFDRQGHHFYLVMEFVDGVTLRRAIGLCRKHGMLIPVPVIAELGRQVCDGLHYAHTACGEDGQPLHLVHRDVKPSNLMLNAQGVVKLLDFGISRALFSREKQGTVKGTWGYMAPEQARGKEIGPPADVFGLASVLYELATLRPLLPEKAPREVKTALLADEAAKRSAALGGPAGALAPVLVRALQRDPLARYSSALAFQRALAGLMANPVTAREQLIHFWATLMELQGESPSTGAYRSYSSLRDGGASGSSQASLGSQASGGSGAHGVDSAASVPSSGQASAAGRRADGGLAVAIGRPPPELELDLDDEPGAASTERSAGPWVGLLVGLVACCVLLFAGYQVLGPRGTGSGGADAGPATETVTLGEVFTASEDPPSLEPGDGAAAEPATPAPAASGGSPRPRAVPPPPARRPDPAQQRPGDAAGQEQAAPVEPPPSVEQQEPEPPDASSGGEPEPEGSSDSQLGLLTVSSLPRSQVSVDGQFAGWSPMLQHQVAAGPHTITLVAEDGRRYTFRVTLTAGEEVRKVWHFDRGMWVEQ